MTYVPRVRIFRNVVSGSIFRKEKGLVCFSSSSSSSSSSEKGERIRTREEIFSAFLFFEFTLCFDSSSSSNRYILKEEMAGENSLSASGKKSSDATNDIPTFSAENLQSNMRIIYYSRTFLSIIAGVISGIFGFTSLAGFVFYFCVMAMTSVGLAAKTKFSINSYFDCWNRITLDGFLGGLMSYVLFWTFAYDIVHIF